MTVLTWTNIAGHLHLLQTVINTSMKALTTN